jgi:hypothetical protein
VRLYSGSPCVEGRDLAVSEIHGATQRIFSLFFASMLFLRRSVGFDGESEVHSLAALSLGGNDGYVRTIGALHKWRGGHLRDALAEGRRGMDLAPANPWVISNVALLHSLSGRDVEALQYAGLAVELAYPKDSHLLALIHSDAALVQGATQRQVSSPSRLSTWPIRNTHAPRRSSN